MTFFLYIIIYISCAANSTNSRSANKQKSEGILEAKNGHKILYESYQRYSNKIRQADLQESPKIYQVEYIIPVII